MMGGVSTPIGCSNQQVVGPLGGGSQELVWAVPPEAGEVRLQRRTLLGTPGTPRTTVTYRPLRRVKVEVFWARPAGTRPAADPELTGGVSYSIWPS